MGILIFIATVILVKSIEAKFGHTYNIFSDPLDIKLQGSILPFGIGSVIKLSYTKGAMQKRNIYLPKGAMNQDEWLRVLVCRV